MHETNINMSDFLRTEQATSGCRKRLSCSRRSPPLVHIRHTPATTPFPARTYPNIRSDGKKLKLKREITFASLCLCKFFPCNLCSTSLFCHLSGAKFVAHKYPQLNLICMLKWNNFVFIYMSLRWLLLMATFSSSEAINWVNPNFPFLLLGCHYFCSGWAMPRVLMPNFIFSRSLFFLPHPSIHIIIKFGYENIILC